MREPPKAQDATKAKMLEMKTMDNPQETIDVAWLAGIWDGEGTITVRRNKKINQISPRCSMVNTNPLIVEKTVEILNRIGINPVVHSKGTGGFEGSSKECWIVSVHTLTGAKKFLDAVAPFLVGKSAQAKLLARFVNSRIDRRSKVKRNSDCQYSQDEITAVCKLYEANGNIRGSSETTREAMSGRAVH